ncbi:hypothetical protein HPB49_007464 [Dermacentor silvarum]|uniref:Uncharacterized protein n=1 Tax=Dermacentor silvarum TaxID=543639 RepID=A0ACB8C2I0_DERSI|nr:hypothetical protein HPB49_007464 [Dermacentor silvarum]
MHIYKRYGSREDSGNNAFVICASTGKAAVAVGGTTVHAAFKLSRKRIGTTGDGGLNSSELNTFRVAFQRVKCVIIDEVSMMSADQLRAVDCRLHGLFGATVTGHYLDYFPLVRVVRQAYSTFSTILTKIGDGRELDEEDVHLIDSRFVSAEEALARAPSAVRIFYSNDEVQRFNTFVANRQQEQREVVCLRACDTLLGCKTQHANSREAQPSKPSSCPEGERNKQQDAVTSKDQHEPAKGVDSASTGRDTPPDVQLPVSVTESVEECMDASRDGASSMAGKRAYEMTVDSEQQRDDGGGGEPPTKTPGVRRSPYRPRPNIPGEPLRAVNPPP